MFKKIFIFIFIIFTIISCGDDTGTSSGDDIQAIYETKNFSITIPAKWDIIKNVGTILPKPSNGEIVFDAASNINNDDFYRNILVLKQEINSDLTSLDFIIGNYIGAKKEYFYIKSLAEKNVIINSKKTKLYQFEARYSEDTPIVKFLQTGIICNNNGYIITIAIEKSNLSIDRYEGLLASFKCKAPHSVSPLEGDK